MIAIDNLVTHAAVPEREAQPHKNEIADHREEHDFRVHLLSARQQVPALESELAIEAQYTLDDNTVVACPERGRPWPWLKLIFLPWPRRSRQATSGAAIIVLTVATPVLANAVADSFATTGENLGHPRTS